MARVIALDPGGTTGWATWTFDRVDTGRSFEYYGGTFNCGHLGPGDHHNQLDVLLGIQHVQDYRIVCESFEYRNKSRAGLVLDSVEYIGVVKRFGQERRAPVVFQTASEGKGFGTDVKLDHMGWLQVPKSKWPNMHMNDAARHLLLYLVKSKFDPRILTRLKGIS